MAKKKPNRWRKQLKDLRERLDLTQSEMAERVGVAPRTWMSWEYGHRQPSGPAKRLILNAFPELA